MRRGKTYTDGEERGTRITKGDGRFALRSRDSGGVLCCNRVNFGGFALEYSCKCRFNPTAV
jgi:hypothetical protein